MVVTRDLHLAAPLLATDGAGGALGVLLTGREIMTVGVRSTEGALLAVGVIGAGDHRLADLGVSTPLVPGALAVVKTLGHLQTGAGGGANRPTPAIPVHGAGARRDAALLHTQRPLGAFGVFGARYDLPTPAVGSASRAVTAVRVDVAGSGRDADPARVTGRATGTLQIGAAREELDLLRARSGLQKQRATDDELNDEGKMLLHGVLLDGGSLVGSSRHIKLDAKTSADLQFFFKTSRMSTSSREENHC